jgi:hypothetical protein
LHQGNQDSDQFIGVWDIQRGERVHLLQEHLWFVRTVGVSGDGTRAMSSSNDKTIRIWDLETGECLQTLTDPDTWMEVLIPSPDGRGVVSWDRFENARLWDMDTGRQIKRAPGSYMGTVVYAALTPDASLAILGCRDDDHMHVSNLRGRERLRSLNWGRSTVHRLKVPAWTLTPDGRSAVSGSYDGTLAIWDIKSGACVRVLAGHSHWVLHAVVTTDGRHIISASRDRTIRVWDVGTGECLAVCAFPNDVTALCTAGDRVLAGDAAGRVAFLGLRNLTIGPSFATAVRAYDWRRRTWDDHLTATCPSCRRTLTPPPRITDAIAALQEANPLTPEQIPCLDLPEQAWNDPALLMDCPQCHQALRLMPFVVDLRPWYGAE